MAKQLKRDPITASDLQEFVNKNSDFAFEMKVLAQLRGLDFDCEHAATYQDPVTGKIRQFDIRAVRTTNVMTDDSCTLVLAVECKNLHESHPLLLSAVPRTDDESFHDLLIYERMPAISILKKDHVVGERSAYKQGEMVGKKTDQVGRDTTGLVNDDSATFDKLNQAVNSCRDLVLQFVLNTFMPRVAIVPVLVVPPDLLWQVDYAADGNIMEAPRKVQRSTLFLDHTWPVDRPGKGTINYRLSHIEFVTVDTLPNAVEKWFGPFGFFGSV